MSLNWTRREVLRRVGGAALVTMFAPLMTLFKGTASAQATTSTAWYLCPYDTLQQPIGLVRVPAIARYIPTIPNSNGDVWDGAEILGNQILVKVEALAATHAAIQADSDFITLPDVSVATVPATLQQTVQTKLVNLGYLPSEIQSTGFNVLALYRLITSVRSPISKGANTYTVQTGRLNSSKTVNDILNRLAKTQASVA